MQVSLIFSTSGSNIICLIVNNELCCRVQSRCWVSIRVGVPQGSILGPLLFLVFINDIVDERHANVRLFADDTSIYIIVDHPQSAADILNSDLQKVQSWADSRLVICNPNKTESL